MNENEKWFITSLPRLVAIVLIPATSDPAIGSVTPYDCSASMSPNKKECRIICLVSKKPWQAHTC